MNSGDKMYHDRPSDPMVEVMVYDITDDDFNYVYLR